MGSKSTTSIKERWERQQAAEARILQVLSSSNKRLEEAREAKRHKKKSLGELLAMTNFTGIEAYALRPIDSYVPKSYNVERQVYALIDHMYVKYKVPGFLYQACLAQPVRTKIGTLQPSPIGVRVDPFANKHWDYRHWFVTIAQGGSFRKKVKDIMTSREAAEFLNAPATNLIHENVWWARMTVAGIPHNVKSHVLNRILSTFDFTDADGRLREAIAFYARYYVDMNKSTLAEITDFLAWRLNNDPTFRLQGRTLTSVTRLSNEWHILMQKAKLGSNITWAGLGIAGWENVTKNAVWRMAELQSNRDLLNEGRKQKHCVYSYVQHCIAGRSYIFSLRGSNKAFSHYDCDGNIVWNAVDEFTRITVEVNSQRAIVQVRGALNRAATEEERKILRMWAGEKGFTYNG
jgi:hypothetical protein